jgi:hypothetical protein
MQQSCQIILREPTSIIEPANIDTISTIFVMGFIINYFYNFYCLLSFFTSRITNSRYFFNSIPSNSIGCSVSVKRCFFSLVIFVKAFCISISTSARPIWPKSFDSKAYLYIDLRKSLLAETRTAELYIHFNIRNAPVFKTVNVATPNGG